MIDAFTGTARDGFAAAVDAGAVGLIGYSYGGATAFLAVHGGPVADPRIGAAAVLAPLSCPFEADMFGGRRVPFLIVHGSSDRIVDPAWSRRIFPLLRGRKFFIEVIGGDHVGFDPSLNGLRDGDVLPLYHGSLRDRVPGGEAAQAAALIAALAPIAGTDAARCFAGSFLPDPDLPRDPLVAVDEQLRIADVALTAFVDGFVGGDAGARRFVAGFPRRAGVRDTVRFCAKRKGRGTCRGS